MSSDEIAVRVSRISKCYEIYDRPQDRLKQSIQPRLRKLFRRVPRNYYREFWALRDVSIDVRKGETVGIIGRNGSGKSTLLQIICGTLAPTAGTVETSGRIAALLELGSGFNPEFTGRENIHMNAAVLGLSADEISDRFHDIVAFADIGDFIDQPIKTYSSGMVVRLAFAVSVCVEPEILVVDEALAVGDMAFQQKCLQQLTDLREHGTTVLLVTHDIMLTRNYCSRVVYLDSGVVKQIGDPEIVGEVYLKDLFSMRQGSCDGTEIEWRAANGRAGFGTARGQIIGVKIRGAHSAGNVFQAGERVSVTISAKICDEVQAPELVFQLRDFRGYVLYGIRSAPDKLTRQKFDDHVLITAKLEFIVELAEGEYGITIGLNDRHGEALYTLLDKVVSIVTFSVAQDRKDNFHGCINLHAIWRTVDGSKDLEWRSAGYTE
jgi:lipopolysaccharide transport system ATP-binding protein